MIIMDRRLSLLWDEDIEFNILPPDGYAAGEWVGSPPDRSSSYLYQVYDKFHTSGMLMENLGVWHPKALSNIWRDGLLCRPIKKTGFII